MEYRRAKSTKTKRAKASSNTSKYTKAERAEYGRRMRADRAAAKQSLKYTEPGRLAAGGAIVGGAAGEAFGGPLAGLVGTFLGGKIGHLAEVITGFGEYKVASNSILRGGAPVPQIVNSINTGGTIVRHCEYIGDISSTQAFTATSYDINPGLSSTFPWLSQIAGSYEQYRMRGCIFEFRSTSSNALLSSSTSTALGTIVMGTQYDVSEPRWSDKRTMLNHEYSNSVDPSRTGIHLVECKRGLNVLSNQYTRTGAVPNNKDSRLYDLGRFTVATVGMQADGGVLGELWVTYEVELMKQQFNVQGYQDQFQWSTWTNANILGTDANDNFALSPYSTIGGYISTKEAGSQGTYFFPPNLSSGYYMLSVSLISGSAGASTLAPSVTFVNSVIANEDGVPYHVATAPSTQASNHFMMCHVCRITAPGAKVRYGTTAVLPTVGGAGRLFVMYLGPTGQAFDI